MSEHQLTTIVKDFYNNVAVNLDFVCTVNDAQISSAYNEIIKKIHPEIMKRYYGSGFFIPEKVEGLRVVDFGCGSGSLVFILSKLVGENGYVEGVDVTPNLILEAKKFGNFHRELWGYKEDNFKFRIVNIEDENDIGLKNIDVAVSNGVLCLCPNKRGVFQNIYNLLKDGGEFCLSDVYADRERPADKLDDPKLFSLGTTGSMMWTEMGQLPVSVGFSKPYLKGCAPVKFDNKEIHDSVNNVTLACAEWRLFKLPAGARRGPAEVTYKGGIFGFEDVFTWDINTAFKKGEPVAVDSDLATILSSSRFNDSFTFKDISTSVQTPCMQNPFEYLDKLRASGAELTYAYTI